MPVTVEQVRKTAALARIELGKDENARDTEQLFAKQIENIIAYMDILNEVDTEGVEPLYSPMEHIDLPRPDKAFHSLSVQEVLQNAPESSDTFFVVPPVIS